MKHFLKTINLVLAHRWINENPFELYKNKVKAKEKQFLTADELERIKLKDFRIPRLNHVELCKSSSILKQSLGIQVEDEKEMVYRMGEYSIMLMRRYQLPIKQYVVFLKDIKPLMPTFLAEWISS